MASRASWLAGPTGQQYVILTVATYALPALATIFAVYMSIRYSYNKTVGAVLCYQKSPKRPVEFLPSVSGAILVDPQRSIWLLIMVVHILLRPPLFLLYMHRVLYKALRMHARPVSSAYALQTGYLNPIAPQSPDEDLQRSASSPISNIEGTSGSICAQFGIEMMLAHEPQLPTANTLENHQMRLETPYAHRRTGIG